MDFCKEIETLTPLALALKNTRDLGEKQEILLAYPRVKAVLSEEILKPFLPPNHDLSSKIAFFSIIAIGQEKHLFAPLYPNNVKNWDFDCAKASGLNDHKSVDISNINRLMIVQSRELWHQPKSNSSRCLGIHKESSKENIRALLTTLVSIDHFYESLGGIVGYQLQVLRRLGEKRRMEKKALYVRAPGMDLTRSSADIEAAVLAGIRALPETGEIYPIGGLGSRLSLLSQSGEPLPAACLPFSGHSLLEGLIRDVQAREFLYYRLFHKQVTVPIAMMTSFEKKNTKRVRRICEKNHWFGRPKESFFLFPQLSVPVVGMQGEWILRAPLKLLLQPGGHGALWRTAEEKGVFVWFREQDKHRLLIRQINNPIGGIDLGLLALMGIGKLEQKAFGFASCERLPNAAEGVLVMKEETGHKQLSNIEYTDFAHYGIEDCPAHNGYSPYPANTNILYADIKKLQPVIKKTPLPGLIMNMKNTVLSYKADGEQQEVLGGRLESMMQNLSDALPAKIGEPLSTFLTYNERRRTISATKRSFEAGKTLMETPEGAFYDLLYNAHRLLKDMCGVTLSDFCTEQTYLDRGPSHIFLYHPALGPLYHLIAQKIRGGQLEEGAELQLEIADIFLENLDLEGSALIYARNVMGHRSQGIIRYSQSTGKCILKHVKVRNKGINRSIATPYWKNHMKRHQSLKIILEGHSEFYAEDIVFSGHHTVVVPHGERWIAKQSSSGKITYQKEKAGWQWRYHIQGDQICSGQYFS